MKSTVLIVFNLIVLLTIFVYSQYAIKQQTKENVLRVLAGSFTTNYIIRSGEYKGEFATGTCLDSEADKLLVSYTE